MRFMPFRRIATTLAACAALAGSASGQELTVFAAASLKNALQQVAEAYEAQTGTDLHLSFAGSSALARQIQAGAPADVFISAHPAWMDVLAQDGLIAADSRFDLLGNRLVLVAHGSDVEPFEITKDFDLAGHLGDQRLAMALAGAVPAGIYTAAALDWLGQWQDLAPRTAQVGNVRIALALVARGETPFGVVYHSDALAEPGVTAVGLFPLNSHPPIVYPAAALSDDADAERFLMYLQSDTARAAFEAQGFIVLAGE